MLKRFLNTYIPEPFTLNGFTRGNYLDKLIKNKPISTHQLDRLIRLVLDDIRVREQKIIEPKDYIDSLILLENRYIDYYKKVYSGELDTQKVYILTENYAEKIYRSEGKSTGQALIDFVCDINTNLFFIKQEDVSTNDLMKKTVFPDYFEQSVWLKIETFLKKNNWVNHNGTLIKKPQIQAKKQADFALLVFLTKNTTIISDYTDKSIAKSYAEYFNVDTSNVNFNRMKNKKDLDQLVIDYYRELASAIE